jgi:hypothetical protein
MKYFYLILLIFLFVFNDYAIAKESRTYCDYYDDMGDFLLTFDANIRLGPSGESRTSGIKFIFSDSETLSIYTIPSIYIIDEIYNGVPPDIYDFAKKYMREGCVENIGYNFNKIICENSEYSLRLDKYNNSLFCTYIIYNATHGIYNGIYKNIINSMLFFKKNDLINNNANAIVTLAGWPNYNKRSPYDQPRLFCGKYQIRSDLIRILAEARQ